MRSLSFRGHGQRTGYNPIQYPSFVNRIEEETNRTLRAMRDAHQGDMELRRENLAAMRSNALEVKANRTDNFNLARGFDKAYRDTEKKQLDLERQQLNVTYQHRLQKEAELNKIKELIPKTLMAGAKAWGVRSEKLQNEGSRLALKHSLTPEALNTISFLSANEGSQDLAINKIRRNLENQYGPEVLNQFLDVSGAKLHGMMIGAATNYGKYHLPQRYAQLANKKLSNGISLNDIISSGDISGSEFEAANKEIEGIISSEVLYDPNNPDQGGFNATFAGLHIKPFLDKEADKRRTIVQQNDMTAYAEQVAAKETQLLKNAVFDKGGLETSQPLGDRGMNWIETQAGGDSAYYGHFRKKAATYLAEMASTGEMTYEEWEAIKEGTVNVGGKDVLIGQQWKKDWEVVENAFSARIDAEHQALLDREERIKKKRHIELEELRQTLPGKRFSFNELELHKKVLINDGIDPTKVEYLKTYESLLPESVNAKDTESYLKNAYNAGVLNPMIMLDPRLDGTVVKQWEKFIPILGDETVKSSIQDIGQVVKEEMNQLVAVGEQGYNSSAMVTRAEEILRKNILQGLQRGEYDTAAEAAKEESKLLVEKIKNKQGEFRVNADQEFVVLKNPKLGRGSYYVRHIKNNKAFISTPGVFADADLKAIQDTNINGVPDFIKTINTQYPKRDPYEIMNEILSANNLKEIEPMGLSKSYRYVHPKFKQYLCNKPSMAKTCSALNKTTKITNPDYDPFLPMLDAIKDKGAVNADEQYSGFDAYTSKDVNGMSTGTEVFGKSLTDMSAGEVLNNQGLGRVLAAGPYSIDQQDLRSMIEKGYIGLDQKFDENTQRTIAQLMLWDKAGKFFVDSSSKGIDTRTILPGLGQEWVQIAGPGGHISEDEEVAISQKLELVKQNLEKVGGFNLLQLRDEVQESMYHKLAGAS